MDKEASTGQDIANLFGDFFSSVYAKKENLKIPSFEFKNTVDISNYSFSKSQIFSKISRLKNKLSSGPDGLPPFLIKICCFGLTNPLHIIFNKSLQDGVFPEKWKISYLVPIWKNGDKEDAKNYRGVCIQSTIPKVLDSLISENLSWDCRNVITSKQHGFCSGRSTATNLLVFTEYITSAFVKSLPVLQYTSTWIH